ncbi:MAG: hypothetical protein HGB12_12910 [Bacteroidetes bacterium]|nr:hypothetical protein [Bacteroidota bacterium]
MKKIIFITLFALALASCSKDKFEKVNLCDSPLCNQYYEVWKNIFLNRNNMTKEYFDKHIIPFSSEISTWNSGESFRVRYQVNIDWMICKLNDPFIIKTSEITYPSLTIPRGVYLTEFEINQAISASAFSSSINVIGSIEHLKYSSKRNALRAIRDKAGNNKIDFENYRYYELTSAFTPNGHPYMQGNGIIDKKENKCIDGTIDLVTGDCVINECACWIE